MVPKGGLDENTMAIITNPSWQWLLQSPFATEYQHDECSAYCLYGKAVMDAYNNGCMLFHMGAALPLTGLRMIDHYSIFISPGSGMKGSLYENRYAFALYLSWRPFSSSFTRASFDQVTCAKDKELEEEMLAMMKDSRLSDYCSVHNLPIDQIG